jgi:ADP-L-glycero-D-manno-heptose 6-epimerase
MIVVTGGAGFIGSNVVEGLQKQGYKDIVVVDWLGEQEKWKNIAKRELAAIVAPEDMYLYLNDHYTEIEAIIHMGAISTTTETDVDLIIRSNFELSWKLWEYCRDNQIQFIYASSAATYGDGTQGFVDDNDLVFLNNLRPLNPYGWSKALFDRKVSREILEKRKTPMQYVGLKFFNVYGPNEYHKGGQKSVISHIFHQVKNDEEVKLFKSYNPSYKDGEQLRDFVWVGDVVDVILWMLKNPQINGIYNVGSGEARSFYDLAKATWNALGKEAKIGFKDMPETLRDKYQYYTKADLTRLRQAGYIQEMTKLEDGVRIYVQDFLIKEDQYR